MPTFISAGEPTYLAAPARLFTIGRHHTLVEAANMFVGAGVVKGLAKKATRGKPSFPEFISSLGKFTKLGMKDRMPMPIHVLHAGQAQAYATTRINATEHNFMPTPRFQPHHPTKMSFGGDIVVAQIGLDGKMVLVDRESRHPLRAQLIRYGEVLEEAAGRETPADIDGLFLDFGAAFAGNPMHARHLPPVVPVKLYGRPR